MALLGFFCLIVSVRWWLIGRYGNPVPFWDQWDAEAAILYPPYVSGHLTWATLISPHNEHRILTTRLLALGLFSLNGEWNPLLEMAVNAIVLASALTMLGVFLSKSLRPGSRPPLYAFLVVLYAVPYASENTLAGFQAQFYFNLLFSFLSLWLLVTHPVFRAGWWGGVFASLAAYFSLASGVFALAAAIPIIALQAVAVRRRPGPVVPAESQPGVPAASRWRFLAIALLAGLFVIGYAWTPQMPTHMDLKAHSAKEFITALMTEMSWPRPVRWRHALIMNLPVLMFLVLLGRRRISAISNATWFLLALAIWVAGQMAALAYGRASTVLAPRYLDLLSVGIVVNFACLLWCAQSLGTGARRIIYILCVAWACYVAAGFYHERHEIGDEVAGKHRDSLVQQANVSGYLASGDRGYLYGKSRMDIPYPDPARLQMLLDDPAIRRILPSALLPPSMHDRTRGVLDGLVEWVLEHAWIAAVLGVVSLACAGVLGVRNRTSPVSGQFVQEVQ
ncbi:hypothetical protein [Achromobacter aloeverae]